MKTERNKRSGFIRSTFKPEIQLKKAMYFLFDFGWLSIHFDIVR